MSESIKSNDKNIIIQGENVSFSYNKEKIFNNINFTIFDKEFLGIIGPNGGGKTTFIKILLGLLKGYTGILSYPNPSLFSFPKDIGYVPQNTQINLNFPIMAIEVVEMGILKSSIFGFRLKKKQRQAALEILDKLGIKELAYKKIGELSGGQIQRVLIARAINGNPKLLILDEPTSNIDTKTQTEIYKLLKAINKIHTIITISHDIPITLEYATRILHINRAVYSHDIPPITLNKDGHICEIDIFQDFISNSHNPN
ncbi:ABC transporter ATP-binding protein [Helicobacter muridarum]|uniref:ABC transporter ATP-binding protein n=1 Tax=Helicobacter muridarum TaxID=216 RepID=A0A377PW43_9HELI|nr:ABC transporter ATP-binding protein [Helicobacter muridarum]TLD99603.1 ABC transporter ATP-binding protein [Helicobacter muridarum]STQ86787.1 ABC transporter ATP-binding protein [Helicobacter muridarum]